MTDRPRKKAHVVTGFNDIGTGESFSPNDTPMIDAGAYENYKAAGLIRDPDRAGDAPARARAVARSKAPRKPAAARSKTRKSKPAVTAPPAPPAPDMASDA